MVERTSAALDPLATSDRAVAMARKYVWWQGPERTLAEPAQLLAQIMTLGTPDDVRWMLARASRDDLHTVLRDPPIGIFNGRSWSYWHRWLGQAPIPPLPTRTLPP